MICEQHDLIPLKVKSQFHWYICTVCGSRVCDDSEYALSIPEDSDNYDSFDFEL